MVTIGIDFSLNSPSVCINTGEKLKFISFFNTDGDEWNRKEKPLKKYKRHNELNDIIEVVPYTRNTLEPVEGYSDYSNEQIQKMKDAQLISNTILEKLAKYCWEDTHIAIEGFAYGSKGMSFIDLILFNSFLRKDLARVFGFSNIIVISPKEAKKFAGNGNADKFFMIDAFVKNKANDELLASNPMHQYIANISELESNPKPIDDLVDSYWIMKTAKEKYLKQE